jgi:hypothetical protein
MLHLRCLLSWERIEPEFGCLTTQINRPAGQRSKRLHAGNRYRSERRLKRATASQVKCIALLCRLVSQFQAHPVMIKVLAVQKYFLADRTLFGKSFALVKQNSALVIRPNTQIDLLHDLSMPRPVNERVEH